MPYIELMFVSRGKKNRGVPLYRRRPPCPWAMCLLAPHGSDALEDDTAHERDTHSEAGEGE